MKSLTDKQEWGVRLREYRRNLTPAWVGLHRVPDATDRALYLNFDDGPHPVHTPILLDLLKACGAKATFFVVGENARRYPHLVRRMVEEGHTIGNHTETHADLSQLPTDKIREEIEKGHQAIQDAVKDKVHYVRPPWGRMSWRTWLVSHHLQCQAVFWSHDSGDWKFKAQGDVVEQVMSQEYAAGDILLFHEDYAHTLQAMPFILSHLTAQGWELKALPATPEPASETRRELHRNSAGIPPLRPVNNI